MDYINPAQGQLLYEKIQETLAQPGLTARERIPKYRGILEELFRALTAGADRVFSDFFSRVIFVQDEYKPPTSVMDGVHDVRRLANALLHDVAAQAGPADDARCLFQLCRAIEHFSETPPPQSLQEAWKPYQAQFGKTRPEKKEKRPSYSFRAVVRHIQPPNERHTTRCASLRCETDELGAITIHFWDNRDDKGHGSDLSVVAEWTWPYCTLYLTNITPLAERPGEYKANDNSLVVLEPDYLVEAKELAECRQQSGWQPVFQLLKRFNRATMTEAMMMGNVAGQMLDEIVTNPHYQYKTAFEKAMRDHSFGMLCLAHQEGRYDQLAIKKLYDDAHKLETTIRRAVQSFEGKRLSVEPTFYSADYGLQGRLDLMIEDPQDPRRKDIVEMKAGNHHRESLYPNHEAQAVAYSLLLESAFPQRRGQSAILYAKADPAEKPLRAVRETNPLLRQQLLLARNQIVAQEYKLAAGDFSPLQALHPDRLNVPKYSDEHLQRFSRLYAGLDPLRRAYFHGFVQFIFRELQTAKIGNPLNPDDLGGFSALWKTDINEKIRSFNALVYLRIREVSPEFHITLDITGDLFSPGISSFREGETAILYPTADPQALDPLHHQILKCTILKLGAKEVVVSLNNKQLDRQLLDKNMFWALEHDLRESGFRTLLSLTFDFLQAPADKQQVVLGLHEPAFSEPPQLDASAEQLNDNQRDIVARALSAQDYFLIQGPPGTGKTSTVLMALVHHLAREKHNVLIIAFTNQAVKVICERLHAHGLDYIRLGRGDDPQSWATLAGRLKLGELHERVSDTHIFVSTQATFANSLDLLNFKQFHTLIIDEASQLLEPQLIGLLPRFKRFIMIGDDNQLPAVVQQSEEASACSDPALHAIGLRNFRESLFTRLLNNARARGWNRCHGLLEYHYRMHIDIADYPNRVYYSGRLKPGLPQQQAPLRWPPTDHPLHHLFTRRVTFVPTRPDPRSKINEQEAQLAADLVSYVHRLYGDRFDPATTVGIITPFRAQIATIRQKLPPQYQDITVDTVERFQGSERDVIIVSFAVKNPLQLRAIQSLNTAGVDRKLNVAMTRAREHLVMLGVPEVVGPLIGVHAEGSNAGASGFG